MACSHIIDTYTNAKYIYRGVSRFFQSFTCGKCSSCISRQRTDWRVRTYYESVDCLKKKSNFVLFDTLTYADKYIKRYSDVFPEMAIPELLNSYSFSRDDVQRFFKRLRVNLKRAGYHYKPEELRYILTSEYGSSEKTRGFENTHRPHYHILFFISFPITPVEFSRFVSRAWHLGKTDGVRPYDNCSECPINEYCKGYCIYQSPQYVINERVVNNDTPANCMKCVNYVTKYISKDMYNSDILQQRVDLLFRYLYPDYYRDIFQYRLYRRFCGQVLPFHLQSEKFGLSLLDDADEREYLIKTNQVHLPTSDKNVVLSVALPRYYQKKLYYDYVKVDGRVKWSLNEFGIKTKLLQLDNRIAAYERDYRAYDDEISDEQLHMMSVYKYVYRGTFSDYLSLMLPYREYYRRLLLPHDDDVEVPLYYNYNTKRDRLTLGSFLSTSYSVTSDGEIIHKGKQLHKEFIPYDGYVVVTDKVCPYWHGFDARILAYDRWRSFVMSSRDAIQYVDDKNRDYYKQLGLIS